MDEEPVFRLLPDDAVPDAELEQEAPDRTGARASRRWLAVAAVAVLGAIVLGLRTHQATERTTHPVPAPSPTATTPQPWPTSAGVCGSRQRETVLGPLAESGGPTATVQVGGSGLFDVELDSGRTTAEPVPGLDTSGFVRDQVDAGADRYLEVASCTGASVVRAQPGHAATPVLKNLLSGTLLADGTGGVWSASYTAGTTIGESSQQVTLVRLDRAERVPLPAVTYPLALHGRLLVAQTAPSPESLSSLRMVVFDLDRRRVVRDLGPTTSSTVSAGWVAWLPAACSAGLDCELRSYHPATGEQRDRRYTLPADTDLNSAVFDQAGDRLALKLPRPGPDPRYSTPDSPPESDVGVLDLRTGTLVTVPEVELPGASLVGLTFTSDGDTLVLACTAGGRPRVLTWRPGDAKPRDTHAQLSGPVPDPIYLRPLD